MARSSGGVAKDARARIRRAVPSMTNGFLNKEGLGTSLGRMESEYRRFTGNAFSEAFREIAGEPLNRAGTNPALAAVKDVEDYLGRLAKDATRIWDNPKFKAIDEADLVGLKTLIGKAYKTNMSRAEFESAVRILNDNEFFKRVADTAAGYVKIGGRHYRIDKLTQLTTQVNIAQTQREAVIRKAKKTGNDLVQVTGPKLTKDFCGRLVGRVFSVSGKSKTYPPLRNLPNGGPPFHPHCRHGIKPADSASTLLPSAADTPDYLLTNDAYKAQAAFNKANL